MFDAKNIANLGANIALIGGPGTSHGKWIKKFVTDCGGNIALDATETGEIMLPALFDSGGIAKDPLEELCSGYFGIPHPAKRPNSIFYNRLGEFLSERKIKGILFLRYIWCDIWHVEFRRIKERFNIPMVDIDAGASEGDHERTKGRIQALLEMLS